MTPDPLGSALFDAYPDAVLLVDARGRIVRANQAAEALLGYTQDELAALGIEALVPDAARAGHAARREAYQHAPRRRPMGLQMELAARRRDGSEVMVEIALSPVRADGADYVLAAVRAIGEYPRVQQALRRARHAETIARMGRLAVDAADADLVLQEAPRAATEALDADAALLEVHEGGGRTPRSFGSLAGDAVTVIVLPLQDRGRRVGRLEVHRRGAQPFDADERRFLESMASLLATVLQRGASEDALRHAQRLESVGQLTGGIAHDFNNLLTVIQGNLQVLDDWPSVAADEGARELVDAAARAARRGADLTAKLLAFSRRQVLQPRPLELQRFVAPLAELLRRTLDARVRIEVEVAADTPACLADPGQLEAALINLAINARDAMPDGGTLAFRARRCTEPPADVDAPAWRAGGVALAITDTGSGMSEAVRARAFEPFFTTKEAGRGTGLGLATVHGFAHQSHGAVTLDSRPGAGTTVTLYLPAVAAAPSAAPPPVDARPAPHAVPHGLRVLLVEDEPEVARTVRAFLERWGCEVTGCADAESALVALGREAPFDLLLSDVALGSGLRGDQLAARALGLRPTLPVLLMSGYAHEAEVQALPLLRKPFTREQLADAIRRVTVPAH